MEEAPIRVTFEATIDEIVEVTLRWHARTREARRSHRNAMLGGGAATGISFLAVAGQFWTPWSAAVVLVTVAAALAVPIGFLAGRAHLHTRARNVRRYVVEHLGDAKTLLCEVELRGTGVWVKQDNIELLHQWSDVIAVDDTPVGVDVVFRQTLLVVRNRAFATPLARDAFISRARLLAGRALGIEP